MYAIIRSENVIGTLIYSYSINVHLVGIDESDLMLIKLSGSLIKLYSESEFILTIAKYKNGHNPEHHPVEKEVIRYEANKAREEWLKYVSSNAR